ncbi:carbapenem-hydrolyzing class A beta-lactamase [Vibrio diabolicus]|uniref:carbapenem-hydrolyzing class A beta-lactamase n=1 Tax=Vibrio diabolicus TaxID=50719 RepID=UPI0014287AA4|nr:class A beta-lactamase [Vibrio diabolicus]QIR98764.1 class A beta-lactamase [Vibrio diabolicus]
MMKTNLLLCAITLISISLEVSAKSDAQLTQTIKNIENDWKGRIGVYAYDTEGDFTFGYRDKERFPLCSSFKSFLSAAILAKSQENLLNINTLIDFSDRELEYWSPITKENQKYGMTIGKLAQAALQYSDNGATNILLESYIGGPKGMNNFMQSIGDNNFRLDRWELELNTAIPGDIRDTSTPKSMATSLGNLSFGDVLNDTNRELFNNWLIGNTTGDNRIRAAADKSWIVGDKTGSCGVYGAASDIAVIWREKSSPLVMAIYTHKTDPTAKHNDKVIAEVADKTFQYIASQ